MAYVNNGTERSLKVTVYKKVGGNYVQGYPKVYDGQQSWGDAGYPILTDLEARQLTASEFSDRLAAFKAYVATLEPGVDFNDDLIGDGAIRSNTGVCLPTTTTTMQPVWSFAVKYATSAVLPSACGGVVDTAYSNKQFPGVGDYLYADASLTTPWAKGGYVLITSPAIYGTKQVLVAVVNTGTYNIGEIIDTANGFDCSTYTTTVAPTTTSTTTTTVLPIQKYYLMYRCDGETCHLPESVKVAYEYVNGIIQTGDRFYGAIEGNPDYLYTYTGQGYTASVPPTCIVNGISKTSDTCP
ncbi:MAG: hypothetical protein JXR54_10050 [Tannerellaceae bacterium]|nr:hypothetical protein [Tannerellaceae bacterium]